MEEKDFKRTTNSLTALMVCIFIALMVCMYIMSVSYDKRIERLEHQIKVLTGYCTQESRDVRKLISDNYDKMERLVDGYSYIIIGGWE